MCWWKSQRRAACSMRANLNMRLQNQHQSSSDESAALFRALGELSGRHATHHYLCTATPASPQLLQTPPICHINTRGHGNEPANHCCAAAQNTQSLSPSPHIGGALVTSGRPPVCSSLVVVVVVAVIETERWWRSARHGSTPLRGVSLSWRRMFRRQRSRNVAVCQQPWSTCELD